MMRGSESCMFPDLFPKVTVENSLAVSDYFSEHFPPMIIIFLAFAEVVFVCLPMVLLSTSGFP
jgi:hypothetical protein